MTTLFVADLHLSETQPAITAGFLHFLSTEAVHAEALYILGDLFEYWIGDDDPNPLHQQVAQALATLHQQGISCYFIHGNRDFLLGQSFAKASKLKLLPAEYRIILYGRSILLLHGDTLCTDDVNYQKFRQKVHKHWLQCLFLSMPLWLRQRIAQRLRDKSHHGNQYKNEAIMDVTPITVSKKFHDYQIDLMIHGHTHRPAIHLLNLGQQQKIRAVLGAWHHHGSVLRLTADGQIELTNLKFL